MKHTFLGGCITLLMFAGVGCANKPATEDVSGLNYNGGAALLSPTPATEPPPPAFVATNQSTTTVPSTDTAPHALTLDDKLNFKQPTMTIDAKKHYTAVLHTTAGEITVKLAAKSTPITVNNFVSLAQAHFYDNTIFHRVIKGFMIQGGDPKGDGTGGPGYRFADEPFTGEYTRGTIAMANAGPNTNGSQFFIMHQDNPLPKNYVIFGDVTKGIEVVDAIAAAPVTVGASGENSHPVSPVSVTSVDIIEQ